MSVFVEIERCGYLNVAHIVSVAYLIPLQDDGMLSKITFIDGQCMTTSMSPKDVFKQICDADKGLNQL